MKKENVKRPNDNFDVVTVGQILETIKEGLKKIKVAEKDKNAEELALAKREILGFQRKLDELLS